MPARKVLRDLRRSRGRFARLRGFSFEGWLHVVVYRIQVPLSLVYALTLLASFLVSGMGVVIKVFTAVIWVLWTPQLYEVVKGLALAWSRGMAFGHMNPEFAALYRSRYARHAGLLRVLPFAFLVVWAAGFVLLLVGWQP